MKKGFTLVELLATVVILAVLAAIAIPNFSKTKAKAELNQAVAYLRVIRTGQKMYYAKWGQYLNNLATPGAVQAGLGAEVVSSQGYTLTVPANDPQKFTATATKGTDTVTLDETGAFKRNNAVYTPNS